MPSPLKGLGWLWNRRGLLTLSGCAVLLLFTAIRVVGARFTWLAPLVYLPPQVWPVLLISLCLMGIALREFRLALGLALSAFCVAWLGLGWSIRGAPSIHIEADDTDVLRVMTWNQGQHYEHKIAPFIEAQRPDVIALQDAPMSLVKLKSLPEYQGYEHVTKIGEYALLSRYAIQQAEMVAARVQMAGTYSRGELVAARFVIDFKGRPVVVYSVHAMSPRYELDMMVGIQQPYPKQPPGGPSFWYQQRSVIEQLLARLDKETLPMVVLGDWNMPPLGVIYRHITRGRQDAHAMVGSGPGFTCPGDIWTPLNWGKPWLRIDYVLTNNQWQPLSCVTESASQSQHCAVAAQLRLR